MLNAPLITVYRFGVYFTAFLLGYFLLSHEAVQLTLENRRRPLLLAALGMNVGFTVLYWGQNYTDCAILKGFFANACAWVGTLVLSEVIRRIPGFRSLVLGTVASQKR